MARKAALEGGRRDDMIAAAEKLFFENGYEGTSIRMIAQEAGCEVGLLYYYFKNKDEAFEKVMDKFFTKYERDFAELVEYSRRDPFRAMQSFFKYVADETEAFRCRYAGNMHWTVRYAIRERAMMIIEPKLKSLLETLIAYGAKPRLSLDTAAKFLAYGVCSSILHEDRETFRKNRGELQRGTNLIMGLPEDTAELMFPFFAGFGDIEGMTELTRSVEDVFPELVRSEEKLLPVRITDRELMVVRLAGKIVGAVMFSRKKGEIDFLATKPEHRKKGVATRLLVSALAQFPVGDAVSASADMGSRAAALFERFGFENNGQGRLELTVPDGLPVKLIEDQNGKCN